MRCEPVASGNGKAGLVAVRGVRVAGGVTLREALKEKPIYYSTVDF